VIKHDAVLTQASIHVRMINLSPQVIHNSKDTSTAKSATTVFLNP